MVEHVAVREENSEERTWRMTSRVWAQGMERMEAPYVSYVDVLAHIWGGRRRCDVRWDERGGGGCGSRRWGEGDT